MTLLTVTFYCLLILFTQEFVFASSFGTSIKNKSVISKHLKIKTMKLALMALAIEISLARMFVGSWGWAVVIVVLYCALVYVFMARKVLLSKNQNTSNIKPV